MLLEIYENRYSKITIFQKDLQQHHSSIADKQGTNQPCTVWHGYQYQKTPPVLWQAFLVP